jgi:hypothetical protein
MRLRALVLLSLLCRFCVLAWAEDAGHGDHEAARPSAAKTEAKPAPAAKEGAPAHRNDIRVVIDASGSMKQTDPGNLRIPALKLLVNLLPDGARAGIWLFDAEPAELAPAEDIDKAWRTQAAAAAAKIHSKGLYTHIEAALVAPAKAWTEPPSEGEERSLILLTDGKVDISKKPEDNAASRARIASEVLPWLQHLGVKVYSIALSEQSDQELLGQISLLTGGWSETVKDAEQLQRVFVHMFEKAAPRDSVPLKDNRFDIDAGVSEFTALILLRPGAQPTRLLDPRGGEIAQPKIPPNVFWLHEEGYDLITVDKPSAGQWKLQADMDTDNQVMVVTNLKMEVSPIDNYLSKDAVPDIRAGFEENGQPVEREDFLKLLSLDAELSHGAEKKRFPMPRDILHPGQFLLNLEGETLAPGDYALKIDADGKTFRREAGLSFKILDEPVNIQTSRNEDGSFAVTLVPTPQFAALKDLAVKAALVDQANRMQELQAERSESDSAWHLRLPAPAAGDRWTLNLSVAAKTPEGKEILTSLKPLHLEGASAHPEPASHEASETPAAEAGASQLPKPDWLTTALVAAVANLVTLAGGYVGYRIVKKRSEAAIAKLLDSLS